MSKTQQRWAEYERFRRWLKRKHPNEIVGQSFRENCCPLHKFLRRKVPGLIAIRGVFFTIKYGDYEARGTLPRWARRFIYTLDHRYMGTSVRAHQALSTLNTIIEELVNEHNKAVK